MAVNSQPTLVQALYSFKGKNNDELCFKKGDLITITQLEDGGWWEGTLGEKTGWFPSNYVKEYKLQGEGLSPQKVHQDKNAQQKTYRNVVLHDFYESEREYLNHLKSIHSNYLQPIEQSDILSKEEFRHLMGNLSEVVSVSENLLSGVGEGRTGKHFLASAPSVKQTLVTYCSGHPLAASIVEKHKEELKTLLEERGCNLLGLSGGLSRPFRRLDKYVTHLQEFERHMEESHPDRGDTQRALAVYKEISAECTAVRRQKELELEIVNGGVRGWEGSPLTQLGTVLYVGSVAVGPQHADRYFVLFSSTLLVLSVSPRISAFIYEGKLPLTGIKIIKLEDSDNYKNAFEISGPLIETIVAVCQTKEEQEKWVSLIRQQISSSTGVPTTQVNGLPGSDEVDSSCWNVTRLRPSLPSTAHVTSTDSSVKHGDKMFEEEAQILQVIEAYCSSSRYTINSETGGLSSPSRKDFKPALQRSQSQVNLEKVLTDVVVGLQDQLASLDDKLSNLSQDIAVERTAREQLQAIVMKSATSSPLRTTSEP